MGFFEAVSWPIAAVAIAALWRREIRPLCVGVRGYVQARPWRVNIGTASIESGAPVAQALSSTVETPYKALPAADNPYVQLLEQELKGQVEAVTNVDPVEGLMRYASEFKSRYVHEVTYRLIFGSQIKALRALSTAGTASETDALEFFREASEAWRPMGPTFTPWANFLTAAGLVKYEDGRYSITVQGRDFLSYITRERLPESKPF